MDLDIEVSDEIASHFISWNSFKSRFVRCQLSFLTINARSLASKFNEIFARLSNLKEKISFIVVTETHLNESRDFGFEIPGYSSLNYYRNSDNLGGGIKLYYLDHISVNRVSNFFTVSCESLIIRADVPGYGKVNICAIYRPPQNPYQDFHIFLESLMEFFSNQGVILLGDLNINVLDPQNYHALQYTYLLESYGYKNLITLPTHVNQSTNLDGSCLDHIVHNLQIEADSYVLNPNISDHYAVAAVFHTIIENKPIKIKFRDFSIINIRKFKNNINREFLRFNLPFCTIDEHASYIIQFLMCMLNKYFPIKIKILSRKVLQTPWITNKIRKCIDKKHRWYRLAKEKVITYESYKKCCKDLRKLLRVAKSEYYSNKFHSLQTNSKKNWEILNTLLGKRRKNISDRFLVNGTACTDPQIIANEFNKYFINHPLNIQQNIPSATIDFSNLVSNCQTTANFEPCSVEEVSLTINLLKKSGGIYDISGRFLKLCRLNVSALLCNFFNRCLNEGRFPSPFKLARVTPVFKKGSRTEISNHRPISVLTNLSKIFESIIFKRVKAYFENNGFLNPDQYGFRKQRNTELAIFSLLERVVPAFEECSYTLCIFLDFSACFDTVDTGIFLDKMDRYGFRDKEYDLISSYFDNRRQQVIYGNHCSPVAVQSLGVVQGSKCGPLYYDIYSGDLAKLCFDDEFIMFADDTCLTYSGTNLPELVKYANERLKLIHQWCCHNRLSLNPSKCKAMIFTNKKYDPQTTPPIMLGNNVLEMVSNFNYLGVKVDNKLKYDDHIRLLCTKISRMCGVTFKLKEDLNLGSARNLYFACVYSVLTYCICVWGGVLSCTHRADRLSRLHAKCVKNLFSKFCPPNVCVFKTMKLLKLKDIHSLYAGMYMYRVTVLNQCPTAQANLNLNYPDHGYNTRARDNPRLPFPRVDAVKINYNYQFVDTWNSIPENIKSKATLKAFKTNLCNYFINSY